MIQYMVKLSRSHPLDITVVVYRDNGDTRFKNNLQYQFGLVIPKVSRWKRFSYDGYFHDDGILFFKSLSQLSAPLLEIFDVYVGGYEGEEEEEFVDQDLCVFSGGAPLLSQVIVNGMKITSCLPPMSSLNSLQLFDSPEPIGFALFKEILTTSSSLVDIRLDGDVVSEERLMDFAANGQCIDLPSLRSLRLRAYLFPKHQLFCLLSTFRCPGLETMRIAAFETKDNSPDPRPRQMSALSTYPSLRSLELYGVDCPHLGEDFAVTKLPSLTQVTFHRCLTATAFLRTLIPAVEDDVDIWPSLQVIRLDVGSLHDDDVDGFCEVLSYRTRCGKPIKCVKFDTMLVDFIADGRYVAPMREVVRVETCW